LEQPVCAAQETCLTASKLKLHAALGFTSILQFPEPHAALLKLGRIHAGDVRVAKKIVWLRHSFYVATNYHHSTGTLIPLNFDNCLCVGTFASEVRVWSGTLEEAVESGSCEKLDWIVTQNRLFELPDRCAKMLARLLTVFSDQQLSLLVSEVREWILKAEMLDDGCRVSGWDFNTGVTRSFASLALRVVGR
jgi:hypothetical protein